MSAPKPEELVTVSSPFPAMELPTLHVWYERYRGQVFDNSPSDFNEFMAWQTSRQHSGPEVLTWEIRKGQNIGGYFEAVIGSELHDGFFISEAGHLAQCTSVFKQELWKGAHYGLRACIGELFEKTDVRMAVFPVLKNAGGVKGLYRKVGAISIGAADNEPEPLELMILTAAEFAKNNEKPAEVAA